MNEKPQGSETDETVGGGQQPAKSQDEVQAAAQQKRRQQQGTETQRRRQDTDALDASGNVDEGKLRKNQERLNVGPDHKTPDMKKGHRGTFP